MGDGSHGIEAVPNEPAGALPPNKSVTYTYLGRNAVEVALRLEGLEGSSVMLPAYICQNSFQGIFQRLDINPIFIDIDPETYHMDIDRARDKAERADAVLLVHAFGLPAEMNGWVELCENQQLTLIEDCVRSLGAKYNGKIVGSFGSYGIYSLKKVSPVAIGGAVVTNEKSLQEHLSQPQYDAHAVYHSLPNSVQNLLTVDYPDDPEARQLDEITRERFREFLKEGFDSYVSTAQQNATTLRETLEPLGFDFQPNPAGRVNFTTPATVPSEVDRDKLVSYVNSNMSKSNISIQWRNPWSKSYHGADFNDRYPNSRALSDRIVCFSTREMENVNPLIDTIHEYICEFT